MAGVLSSDHSNDTETLADDINRLPEQIAAALSSGDVAGTTLLPNVVVLVAQKNLQLAVAAGPRFRGSDAAVALWDGLDVGGRVTPIHLSYIRGRYFLLDTVGQVNKCRVFGEAHCSTTSGKHENVVSGRKKGGGTTAIPPREAQRRLRI